VGVIKEPPVLSEVSIPSSVVEKQEGLEDVDLSFLCEVAEGVDIGWRAKMLLGKRLLLHVSSGALPEGSKECFVRILEYAEEVLGCKSILVEFEKDRKDRPLLIRTFMYFGFAMLTPDKAFHLVGPARIVMMYDIL